MTKIDLPAGEWAQLRDPDTVTERQRKPYVKAVGRAGSLHDAEDGGLTLLVEVQDALVLAMLQSWSFDLPVEAGSFEDLTHKQMNALRAACQPFATELLPDFGPSPDTDSPSTPSNA